MRSLKSQVLAVVALLLSYVATGRADYIYVTTPGSVVRYDTGGNQVAFASGLNGAHGLALDSTGDIYVTTYDYALLQYTPQGQGSRIGYFYSSWNNGIAWGRDGYIYATTDDQRIVRIDSLGRQSVFAQSADWLGLNGLAFDRAGNLFAAGDGAHGFFVERFNSVGQGALVVTNLRSEPMGLAFDSVGNLYIAGSTYGDIQRFDTQGHLSLFASGIYGPMGIGCDSADNVYVAGSDDNRIYRFDQQGHETIFASGISRPEYLIVQVPEPASSGFFAMLLGMFVFRQSSRR